MTGISSNPKMNLISYALFHNPNKALFEKRAYVRGFYWNARMNNLIYPGWRTHLEVDRLTFAEYEGLWDWLVHHNNLSLKVHEQTPELCEGMLWRLNPAWHMQDVNKLLCRDSDAITTYKEASAVQHWIESGRPFCRLTDNPAHAGWMGGMIGVDAAYWKGLIPDCPSPESLKNHGDDQNFLNRMAPILEPRAQHYNLLDPACPKVKPLIDERLWESNLTCQFVGSPGVNEMEVLRFFQRFDEYNWKYIAIERSFPKLFHWHD